MIFSQIPRRSALFCGIQHALWKLQIEGQLQNTYKMHQGASLITSQCIPLYYIMLNNAMSNVLWPTMSNSIQSRSNTTLASMSSVGGLPSVPNPIGGPPNDEAIGPIEALKQRASTLLQRAHQAAVVARDLVADAADINNACSIIVAQHRKMFLARAFVINPNGTPITNPSLLLEKLKTYKSVKSIKQYNYIIKEVLTNWGDDNVLKAASPEDPAANACRNSRKENIQGYSYVKQFQIEEAEGLDGSLKIILKHKKSGGIVLHVLDIFDVIHEAHRRQGHSKVDKTLTKCTMFYSPTYKLCKLFINDCFICHKKHPKVPARKGAKKPILSSEFRNRFQVDLIDMQIKMQIMRKRDVYGQMQHWIMTMKDHSTGLVYLCMLPWKKAELVAAKLEKFFGFVGYPKIFHTGVIPLCQPNKLMCLSLLIILPFSLYVCSIQTMGRSS
jgi:hypothetical protein